MFFPNVSTISTTQHNLIIAPPHKDNCSWQGWWAQWCLAHTSLRPRQYLLWKDTAVLFCISGIWTVMLLPLSITRLMCLLEPCL